MKSAKQNLTVQVERETVRKAKILAAQQGTSIGRLVARSIEQMVGEHDEYERGKRKALAYLDKGLSLGGGPYAARDALHDRRS
jgi:hypothetical protein